MVTPCWVVVCEVKNASVGDAKYSAEITMRKRKRVRISSQVKQQNFKHCLKIMGQAPAPHAMLLPWPTRHAPD